MGFSYLCISLQETQKILRYFIEIAYNGAQYHGWQTQPKAISVQQTLEEALETLFQQRIAVTGAGRTDAGVHARQMFAHFDLPKEKTIENLTYKLNALLPNDIAVKDIFRVKHDAHARFDAILRTYQYIITWVRDPFSEGFAYKISRKPDFQKMQEAADILMQYNDFQCFSKTKTNVKTFLCNMVEAQWEEFDNQFIFTISADRFLRNMVRAIVGTLLEVGYGNLKPEDLHQIIKSKNRCNAGTSVPAHGLYLITVNYPEEIKI